MFLSPAAALVGRLLGFPVFGVTTLTEGGLLLNAEGEPGGGVGAMLTLEVVGEVLAGQNVYQPPGIPGHLLHETKGGAPWRAW